MRLFSNFTLLFLLVWSFPKQFQWTLSNWGNEKVNLTNLSECRCQDSLALIKLFDATNGPNWKVIWDLEQPMDEWEGISLNFEGCVDEITLNANDLTGELPAEIGDFSRLKKLSLGSNDLIGAIPETIGDLSNLTSINFRGNGFSGSIPTALSKLTKLSTLNLSINELTGAIPEELGAITTLTGLFLNENQLTGDIPIALQNLTSLVSLNLSSNQLTGIISPAFGAWTELTGIGLNNNQLTGGLPISLSNWKRVVSVRLENNQLKGEIPKEYGQWERVEIFYLNDNNLSGCFPKELKGLCDLGERVGFGKGYDFKNNLELPWEGDFSKFCDGLSQLGAICNDGNESTANDAIDENCACNKLEIQQLELKLDIQVIGNCPEERNGRLNLTVQPSNESYNIFLETPENILSEIEAENNLSLENLGAGTYHVTVVDPSNDQNFIVETIEILPRNCFDESKIPQLITPNGDGLNEQFIFEELAASPSSFPDNEMVIFNRWGDIVFQASPYQNNWSGNNMEGQALPHGTYYYVFKLDMNNGLIIKGDITIVR